MTKILLNRKSAVSINHIRDGSIHPRSETFENETTTPFKLQYIYGETTGAESLFQASEELLPPSSSLLSPLEYEDQTVKSSNQPSASVVNTLLPSEGKGYHSLYSGTKRNRQYGTKSTVDSLTKIGEEWSKRNPDGPRIGVGDISKHGGGKLPPHKSHTRGIDVDIRPIRADKVEGRTTWKEASYSQKLTRELIQLMRMHAGIRLIFFNDPTLVKEGLTLRWPGHDNHLHVRFKEPIQTSVDTEQEHFRAPDEITQAWKEEHELDIAQGKTIYLPTRQDSTLFRKVGVFIPKSFQPSAAVDLIVYFHGHIIPACKTCPSEFIKKGIEYYWNTPLFKCLREDLVDSGQNAILVAPTFRPIFASKNNSPHDYGSLNEPGKFDILVNDTLAELQKRGELPVSTQVRNIILSGHSGGGLPMKAILNARNAMKKNIAECWGFECLYFGTSAWESWLKGNPNCYFRHFRRNTRFIPPTKALNKYANFIDVKDGTNHCSIVKEKWRQAIEGSNVLRGGGGGRSPEFALINREVSSLTSLLSGLPGLATLPLSFMTALMGGFQDENHLTNLIFFARHPGLGGRKLTASDPQSLKDEWMSILKTIVRPAIRRMREAGAKPSAGSNSAPFAEPPKTGYYPLVTQHKEGMIVSYAKDGTIVGSKGLMFMAKRSSKGGGLRYHVGIDLPAHKGERVVSCEEGRIVAFYPFVYAGKSFASRDTSKPYTCALLVQHPSESPRIVVNYGEVAPDSLSKLGLRVGSKVEAGQTIGFIGECPGGSSMLHFETYTSGTKSNAKWPQGQPRPNNILNPTNYLLFLLRNGLRRIPEERESIENAAYTNESLYEYEAEESLSA